MPRADSKNIGNQFYQSQFHSPYLPAPSVSPQMSPVSSASQTPAPSSASSTAAKKKHVCPTCDRAFTTSGHLARHSRVHTGERNHKCPFPGCETRCSRQDNLQQHYRIHLSPGSRRSSTRSAIARAMNNSSAPTKRSGTASSSDSLPPSLSSPPALEPARGYTHNVSPPDSPPPLAQATLPATAHFAPSSSRSSPETSYSPINNHMSPMGSQPSYSYRSGTTTYQEQSQGAGFTYVHTTPIHSSSNSANSFSSYSNGNDNFNHNVSHLNPSLSHRDNSPTSLSSRHSISHISHPQSYAQNSSGGPPSPASSHSVSSHTSGPPTPTYNVYEDAHAYQHQNGMMNGQHMGSQPHLVHPSYSPISVQGGRFDSPPPVLAPIQDERHMRRDDRHSHAQAHAHAHASSPYIHHPQPLPTDYQYHQSLGLSHGAWKTESGMRKGVNALVQ